MSQKQRPSPDQMAIPPETPDEELGYTLDDRAEAETEIEPTYTSSYEIKDEKGNYLCHVDLELVGKICYRHDSSLDRFGETQKVRSITLRHNGKTMNILDITQMTQPVQIFMHVSEDRLNGLFSPDKRNVVIPRPDNPIRIAIALHEFGHAKQYENPFFENKKHVKTDLTISWQDDPVEKLDLLREILPESGEMIAAIPKETINHLVEIRLALATNQSKMNELKNQLNIILSQIGQLLADPNDPDPLFASFYNEYTHPNAQDPNWQKQVLQLRKKSKLIYEELDPFIKQQKEIEAEFELVIAPVRNLLKIPTKIKERDATRRAFEWMELLRKKIGIDLAAAPINQEAIESSTKRPEDTCAESTVRFYSIVQKQGEVLTRHGLLYGLSTYDAFDRLPMPRRTQLE